MIYKIVYIDQEGKQKGCTYFTERGLSLDDCNKIFKCALDENMMLKVEASNER